MRRVGLCALLAAALVAGASTAPAEARARCAGAAPSKLGIERETGRTTATLRWRAPRRARGVEAYRVVRDGKVVGQTGRRKMRLRVRPGKRHRIKVVALPSRCRTVRRILVAYRPPGRPRGLVAGDASGATVRLGWRRARRGDRPVDRYRVYRDGRALGDVRGRSTTVSIASDRRYRFAVAAVDRSGRVGRRARAVEVRTGQARPSTPAGVEAVTIDDSRIGLRWRSSAVARGRIAGYRVRRDGVVIAQVQAEQLVVERLPPSTTVSFTVEAIDNRGTASAPSAPVSARTADPPPTTGRAHAFLLATTDRSFEDFQAHYRQIGTVHPTYFDCDGRGALVGRDDALVTEWSRARKVAVLPRVNCQRTAVLHKILTDARLRRQWLDEIQGIVLRHNYEGVALDFEAGPASDRDAYTAFAAELAGALHASGRRLSVVVSPKTKDDPNHPRSGLMDYHALARHADHLFVMAWGVHWSTSAPGPIDPLPWVAAVADYAATVHDPRKIVFGTQLYGLDWGGADRPADALEHADVVARLQRHGAVPKHDAEADAWHASYVDADGVTRELWFPTASTTASRLQLARGRGFGAPGLWRLGNEDQATWQDPLLGPAAW